jgi:hypothetical protein
MKQLIITLLLIVTVAMHTLFSEADPQTATVWDYCGQTGQYTNGSAFQRNLNKVLESLVDKVYSSGGGYNASLIQGNDSAVYGLMQCRGDLDSSNCKQCALAAKTKLVQDCHNTSGFIQLDGCFLHYDNHLFYNDTQKGDDPTENIFCSNGNSSQPEQFTNAAKALLSNITSKAEQSSEFFAAGSVAGPSSMDRHIYSIGQCWRDDLSPRTSCGACLAFAFSNIFESCQIGALAAQFGSRYCYLRNEIYRFSNTSILAQALAPGESRLSPPVSGIFCDIVTLPTINKHLAPVPH